MFSFLRKNKISLSVPEWASFFDSREYSLFIEEIDNYFKRLNTRYEIQNEQVLVEENKFGASHLGLINVAQVCKQGRPKNYKRIIWEHFSAIERANQFDTEFAKLADNFEEVKKYVGVRLYNNEYIAQVGIEYTIGKMFAGDIYSMIVFDFPDSVLNIKPEQATAWNKTVDELFEIGIANIRIKYPVKVTRQALGDFSIWFVQGNHFFTPNIVFDIEERKELIGTNGSLIGLPHRHSAIFYPIENLEVVKAINGLIPTIYGMNLEGPGSLSNNLFWYKNGTFIELPYKIEGEKLQFFPPDSFIEMLNRLQKE